MSRTRAEKTEATPTAYEVSLACATAQIGDDGERSHAWQPVGLIETRGGAGNAIRRWCEQQGESFTGGTLRAVPTSRITERDVTVQTRRQLTLGAP